MIHFICYGSFVTKPFPLIDMSILYHTYDHFEIKETICVCYRQVNRNISVDGISEAF